MTREQQPPPSRFKAGLVRWMANFFIQDDGQRFVPSGTMCKTSATVTAQAIFDAMRRMKQSPTPQQVKSARQAAGMTQSECAARFGYGLRGWQQKEESGAGHRALSVGEYEMLLLLAQTHPQFTLKKK